MKINELVLKKYIVLYLWNKKHFFFLLKVISTISNYMYRYFIQLAYNGTRYHGWQIQPNANTVQEELNKAISLLLREEVNVVGAGRTDTGVHASFFIAHFELKKALKDTTRFCFKLNSFLPNDIRIDKIYQVKNDMHARFSAVSRTYHYYISNKKEPFNNEFTSIIPFQLHIEKMNEASKVLFDYSDFTSFSKLHTDVKTNDCKIMEAEWRLEDGRIVFEIKADRFLRNMVRAIVGTLLKVGQDKLTIDEFRTIIEKKDRGVAGASAKAKGLFLTHIEYPVIN